MVDLETLGVVPGCVILSIGAVFFDESELGERFYKVVNTQNCIEAGLHIDPDTVKWWDKQSIEANKVRTDAMLDNVSLNQVLTEFNTFLSQATGVKVWGNGADFDNAILAAAYKAAGVKQGWIPYNGRCYRTIKNTAPNVPKIVRTGTYHNALDDAISQALHLREILAHNPTVVLK
jgi:hypothetical protein